MRQRKGKYCNLAPTPLPDTRHHSLRCILLKARHRERTEVTGNTPATNAATGLCLELLKRQPEPINSPRPSRHVGQHDETACDTGQAIYQYKTQRTSKYCCTRCSMIISVNVLSAEVFRVIFSNSRAQTQARIPVRFPPNNCRVCAAHLTLPPNLECTEKQGAGTAYFRTDEDIVTTTILIISTIVTARKSKCHSSPRVRGYERSSILLKGY